MNLIEEITAEFQKKVSEELRIESEGKNRFRVFSPFRFDDGDHFSIVLKKSESGSWVLTDEGHTLMHMTYKISARDLQNGTRAKIIESILESFGIEESEGQLRLKIENNDFGNSFYDYVQALLKITDVTFLTRERVRSTFIEDFRSFFVNKSSIPREKLEFDWFDRSFDPSGKYKVDCKIQSPSKSIFVFALLGNDRVKDATITILNYEKLNFPFKAVGIFENLEEINRKVLSRFTDVCEKQFSALNGNEDRIQKFLQDAIQN